MNANIRKFLNSILTGASYRQSHATTVAVIAAGYAVFEDTYTKFGEQWGRGYVLTPTGIAFLQSKPGTFK